LIAATDVTAAKTKAKVHPDIALLQTLFATVTAGSYDADLI
jgi:hypothetical protein